MLKDLLGDFLEFIKTRTFVITALFVVMIAVLVHRLFVLQIVNGEDYLNTFTYRIQKDMEIQSPRGTIYSADGTALAYNKLSYTVVIEDSTLLKNNKTRNDMIDKLLGFVESTGNTAVYDIPLELQDDGTIKFSAGENTVLRFKKDVYSSETLTDKQKAATAQQVYEYMRSNKLFALDDSYSDEEALKILAIRFDLYMKRYEKYLSVTVATDVNDKMVAAVKENADVLPGVSIEQAYTRVYTDSKYFSNITGYVGAISENELAAYQEEGNENYSQNDQIGKIGIESYYETALKGAKGSQKLYVNSLGSVLEVADRVEPEAGNDVYLTIDANLQKAAYDMIEERIAGILLAYMSEANLDTDGEDILIPARDFYFALIDNNIINLSHLSADTATGVEQAFWKKYKDYESQIIHSMTGQINTVRNSLTDEYKHYIAMAYSMLRNDEILDISSLDESDEVLKKWSNGKISLHDLLQYAITRDVVDVSKLSLSSDYLDTNEIYNALTAYISDNLTTYTDFEKETIYYMLDADVISGRDICLLLYEQGILDKDDDYEKLNAGNMSAFQFMYKKIYNMEITPDMLALPPCSGSFVVTDINTGEVKALVSYPGYDANQINNVSYFASLVNNGSSPFYNRATQQALAPGSTFKPLVAIAALEEGVIDQNTYIMDNVTYTKVEPHANCWNSGGHGNENVETAIRDSCNYFFYEIGYRLGSENNTQELSDAKGLAKLSKYAEMFGLNSVTGLELPETEPHVSDESVVRTAIGQATNLYTPAEITRYITTVANSGNLYELSLMDKITDSDGNLVQENQPVLTKKIEISQNTWDLVHHGMYLVCNESSYREKMGRLGVTLAGKSGTAQESEKKPNHGLFTGFAPYENPEIAATLVIANAHGSSNLLDLYADLMCYYFGISNTNSDETDEPVSAGRVANIPERSSQSD